MTYEPIKFIHFGDLHLGMENYGHFDPQTGLNSRLNDFLKVFSTIIETAKKEKADVVFFTGDAFKTREPSPTYQKAFALKIAELSRLGIPTILLVGNHDSPSTFGKAHSLEIYPALAVPNVIIFDRPEVKKIATPAGILQVAGLPWLTKNQLLEKEEIKGPAEKINLRAQKKLAQAVEILEQKINPDLPAVLLAHLSLEGATFGSERSVMLGTDIVLPLETFKKSKFDYIGLGHLHQHQVVLAKPPAIYAGSPEKIDFGEEKETKGFIVGKIIPQDKGFKTIWDFRPTPAREFLTIEIKIAENDDQPESTILKKIARLDLKNKVVRLKIFVAEKNASEISERKIYEKLNSAYFLAGIIKEFGTHRPTEKVLFSDELSSLDPLGVLEKYLLTKKFSPGRQKDLLAMAEKLIAEL